MLLLLNLLDQCKKMQTEDKDFNYYFRQDCLRLFDVYNKLNTFRFTEFVNVWNEMKFYQIFA